MEKPAAVLFDLGDTLLQVEGFDPVAGTEHVLSFAENPRGLSASEICARVEEIEVDLRKRRADSLMEISPFTVHRHVYEPNGIVFARPFAEVEGQLRMLGAFALVGLLLGAGLFRFIVED